MVANILRDFHQPGHPKVIPGAKVHALIRRPLFDFVQQIRQSGDGLLRLPARIVRHERADRIEAFGRAILRLDWVQEGNGRGPAERGCNARECARQFGIRIVRARDVNDAINRAAAAQLPQLTEPFRRVDAVWRCVHEDGFAYVHDARLLEPGRDLINAFVRTVHQQPAQAATPEPAVRDAQLLVDALQTSVALEWFRRLVTLAGFETEQSRRTTICAGRYCEQVSDHDDDQHDRDADQKLRPGCAIRDIETIVPEPDQHKCGSGQDERGKGHAPDHRAAWSRSAGDGFRLHVLQVIFRSRHAWKRLSVLRV
ncbi:hypothetical protein CI15_30320 [Paraburkholderia monticola]|uniref:Uncharacterized protein n=2 Tax=Paraburkholderia monticola TaxID=1399968 RepID=A0A149PED7_9BURK|nr:hypothetical protein CI15_30320 [Paraburkholderia monticola]